MWLQGDSPLTHMQLQRMKYQLLCPDQKQKWQLRWKGEGGEVPRSGQRALQLPTAVMQKMMC